MVPPSNVKCGGSDRYELCCAYFLRLTQSFIFSGRAVAHGAVAYFLDRYVRRRVARHTLGQYVSWPYDPSNPEHRRRKDKVYTGLYTGGKFVRGGFQIVVKKV